LFTIKKYTVITIIVLDNYFKSHKSVIIITILCLTVRIFFRSGCHKNKSTAILAYNVTRVSLAAAAVQIRCSNVRRRHTILYYYTILLYNSTSSSYIRYRHNILRMADNNIIIFASRCPVQYSTFSTVSPPVVWRWLSVHRDIIKYYSSLSSRIL